MNRLVRTSTLPARLGASSLCFAAGVAVLSVAPASASPLDPFIVLNASNAGGSGSIVVPLAATTILPGGARQYQQVGSVPIMDGPNLIATVEGLGLTIRPQGAVLGNGVLFNFNFVAGSTDTTFTLDSALFDIPPNPLAAARMSGNILGTDNNGNGVTVTGLNAGGFAFRTAYNGAAPGGTQFGALFTVASDPAPGGSFNISGALPGGGLYTPIAPASDMSTRWSFRLTAGDAAGSTNAYEIIPSPGAIGLLGMAGLGLLRRSRR